MSWIRKLFEPLGCKACQAQIRELEKELIHWKHIALNFKRPGN
jgi:hypothetical protein